MRTLTRSLLLAAATMLTLEAAPPIKNVPTLDTTAVGASSTATLGSLTYVNKGLVGVGNFSSSTLDSRGDTLGSFSSFKIDTTSWRKNANGSYSGTLYTLPDRGYNVGGLIDYAARIQKFDLSFTPDYTTASNAGQNQLTLAFKGTTTIIDFNGNTTTALNPTGTTLSGFTNVPTASVGGVTKFTVDGEGLAIRADGSFYISDEYGASIYHVSKTGKMQGVITPVKALIPEFSVVSGYSGFTTQTTLNTNSPTGEQTKQTFQTGGRRDNQGMEAVDVTPDGKFLVSMLQSATRQDTLGNRDFNRAYTRLFIYDITQNATPTNPTEHYLVELPVTSSKGVGAVPNKTAQQSELVALSKSTFLVLTRDGNGNGSSNAAYNAANGAVGFAENPQVYKNIALVSTLGATNLAGTIYETTYAPAVTGSTSSTATNPLTLAPVAGIVAATTTDFVNLLNVNQLARFGLNLNVLGTTGAVLAGNPLLAQDTNSISEKWEALSVVPCLDALNPNDYFLMVGNDNDFVTASGVMTGALTPGYNGIITTAGEETVENKNRVLVYRVTLPGFVDPGLVVSATNRAPVMAAKSLSSTQIMGTSFSSILKGRLSNSMRLSAPKVAADFDWQLAEQTSELCASGLPQTHGAKGGLRWWFDGSIRNISEDAGVLTPALDSRANAGAVGLEWEVGTGFVFGLGIGMQDGKSEGSDGSNIGYTGRSVTSYLIGRGDVFFGSFTVTAGTQDFDSIQSAGAYGSTPVGTTEGQSLSAEFVLGATVAEVGGWAVIPMLGLSRSSAHVDGYTEAGIGGVTYPTQRLSTNTASASVELAQAFEITGGSYTPFVRVGYDHDFGGKDQTSNVSVSTNGGTVGVAMTLPNADRDYTVGTLGMRWKLGELNAEASYEYRSGDNGYSENRFNLSLSSSF
jgi:hypothetical protein